MGTRRMSLESDAEAQHAVRLCKVTKEKKKPIRLIRSHWPHHGIMDSRLSNKEERWCDSTARGKAQGKGPSRMVGRDSNLEPTGFDEDMERSLQMQPEARRRDLCDLGDLRGPRWA